MPQENVQATTSVNQEQMSVPPVLPQQPPAIPPPPKKTFPKFIIYGIAGLLVIVVLVVIGKMFFSKKTSSVANITWWGLWEDQATVSSLISSYESSHPNVKINYIRQSPQDYRERLTSAMAKGNGPDIFRFHNTWIPMFRNDLDSLPASVMNAADFAKTFYPIASSDLTSGTGIVGVPLEYDALVLYINEDIFNKSGKNPPGTWDELRVLSRELTVKDDQNSITQSGVALGRTENVDHWPEIIALLMLQNGVDLTNPIGKPAEDALTFFTVFSTVDGVWDETLPGSTIAFASGKLAMYIGPSWRSFEISQQNPNLKFKTVPIPQLPKDNPSQADITYATYWAEGVWSKSTKKAASWEFLKFLTTQDSLQKFYESATKVRTFGEPYPRQDMASILKDHPILGSIIKQAPGAQSWYLASRTFDGPTGINTQLSNYFGDAINTLVENKDTAEKAMQTVAAGVLQVLGQYRLIAK